MIFLSQNFELPVVKISMNYIFFVIFSVLTKFKQKVIKSIGNHQVFYNNIK